ncbi:MAG: AAA family ATPase [Betaproteobacteria bacterium]|nr:AAA family ATPase [Betaproteobacteria bacterium]
MKIRSLEVVGFRSLKNFSIEFDPLLTVIVGENDAGKTSLIECLRVITQDRAVDDDDFSYGENEIRINVEIENFIFNKTYTKEADKRISSNLYARPSQDYRNELLATIGSPTFDITQEEAQAQLKNTAKIFGLSVRANSNLNNLKDQLIEKLTIDGDLIIDDAIFPKFNNIQLDGRQFENVPSFFREVFLKEKQFSIWQESTSDGCTIEDFVRSSLRDYSEDVSRQIREQGILEKLKLYLGELIDIRIEPLFHPKDLSLDAKVKFLENGGEINIENKGDGTKRRITMALLEFKKDQTRLLGDSHTIYLLDEPDTHLHVKAQLDLVKTLSGFSSNGDQIILTTHSPFVLNAVNPSQVRLLLRKEGVTSNKKLTIDSDAAQNALRGLGVENTHLFFSKTIIIVEGETEENFLHHQYFKNTGCSISSALIKVINVEGIQNIVGFGRAILELHDSHHIYVLCDNDLSDDLRTLIDELNLDDAHKFFIGRKEFEDAFESNVLHKCWSGYLLDAGKEPPEAWNIEAIEQLKQKAHKEDLKFSIEIRSLSRGSKKMSKPIFGEALGRYAEMEELPNDLKSLLVALGC